jgi:hypothetical protein
VQRHDLLCRQPLALLNMANIDDVRDRAGCPFGQSLRFHQRSARPETGSGCQRDDDSGLTGSDLKEKGVWLDLDRFDRDDVVATKASVPGHPGVGDIPIDA